MEVISLDCAHADLRVIPLGKFSFGVIYADSVPYTLKGMTVRFAVRWEAGGPAKGVLTIEVLTAERLPVSIINEVLKQPEGAEITTHVYELPSGRIHAWGQCLLRVLLGKSAEMRPFFVRKN